MKATEENYKDIQKYYQGTYVVCPEYSPNEALYVETAGPNGLKVSDVNGEKGFIETPYQLHNPLNIRRHYYQVGEEAYLVSRIPARMWKKGLSSENTLFQRVQSNGTLSGAQFSFGVVNKFFHCKDKFVTTIPENTKDYNGLALSPHWLLHLGTSPTLYLLNNPVGKVSIHKKLVTILKEFNKIPLPPALKSWSVSNV